MKRIFSVPALILSCLAAGGLHAQTLSVDKSSMSFSAPFGGAKATQTLNITSSGASVTFFATTNTTWLAVNPPSGSTPSAVTVTADPTGLNPGPYSGAISIFVGSTLNLSVPVSFTVSTIGASPQSLQFSTVVGTTPAAQNITLSGQTSSFSAVAATTLGGNWLAVGTATGIAPTTLIVSLNSAVVPLLTAGTYNGSIVITPATSPALTVLVTLTVTPTPPVTVSPTSLSLGFQIGGTNNAASQVLTVSTTAGLPLSFTAAAGTCPNTSGSPWVTISPASVSATGSAQVTIGYNSAANLAASATPYTCNVQVSVPGFTPSTITVPVTLLVSTSPLLIVPNAPLNFTYEQSGALPAAQSVTPVATTGTIPVTIGVTYATPGVSWIVAPTSGTSGTAFSVSVNPVGLAAGAYAGTITVTGTGAGNGGQQIPVNLIVANDPLIVANGCTAASAACSLSFAYQTAQALPVSQNINLSSSTGASLSYTATAATASCGNWLGVGGSPGVTNGVVTVSVLNPTALAAGTCTGTITIAATNQSTNVAAPNSPLVVNVTLTVSSSALLLVSPTPVTFTVPVNGVASQLVSLTSTSAANPISYNVTFTTASGGSWLSVNQQSGTTATNNSLLITATPGANLIAGTYTGSVIVTASPTGAAVANSPVTIPVTLTVTAGTLSLTPTTLSFTQLAGGTAPAVQAIQVSSSGQALSYTAVAANTGTVNWLSVTPASGTTNSSLAVTVDGSKLTPGVYPGTITVTAFGPNGTPISGSPATVQVTLTVTAGTIAAAPASLTFTQATGGSAAAQTVNVTSAGGTAPISFTVTATTATGGAWLTATPASGTTPGAVQVSANAGSLAIGQYTGTVTITAPTASGSPISIPVTLNVVAPQTITATPAALAFNFTFGTSAAPAPQTVQVTTTGSTIPLSVTAATKDGANWLSVTPTSGNTPATLSVVVNPQALAAGTYTGTVTINSPNATAATVAVTLTVVTVPTPVVTAIINAASGTTGALAPGENITIFGTGIGPTPLAALQVTSGALATLVGNTQVLFDGVPAPIIYASATQTSVMVPYGVSGRTSTNVQVAYLGVQSVATSFNVVASAPGIYSLNLSGTGPGATLNPDGKTANGPATPAPKGSVVAVYMTGEGQTTPIGTNGTVTPSDGTGLKKPNLQVTATVGGVAATVLYAGSAPGIVSGVMQVNLQIPAGAPSGTAVPLAITVGSTTTQTGITIAVQ